MFEEKKYVCGPSTVGGPKEGPRNWDLTGPEGRKKKTYLESPSAKGMRPKIKSSRSQRVPSVIDLESEKSDMAPFYITGQNCSISRL